MLNDLKVGDKIAAQVARTNGLRYVRGEVVEVWRLSDGSVSAVKVVTGASANRSVRYVNRHNIRSLAVEVR